MEVPALQNKAESREPSHLQAEMIKESSKDRGRVRSAGSSTLDGSSQATCPVSCAFQHLLGV